MTGEKKMFTSF
jgi:hypothetical protein